MRRAFSDLFGTESSLMFITPQALGKLILSLACAGRDLGLSPLDHCAIHYSVDLVRLISALLASAEGGQLATWRHLAGALSDRSLAALDSINSYNDGLVQENIFPLILINKYNLLINLLTMCNCIIHLLL